MSWLRRVPPPSDGLSPSVRGLLMWNKATVNLVGSLFGTIFGLVLSYFFMEAVYVP